MDEMEFDRTRKAIKSEKLDAGSRKDLIDKFSGAGGKVLREKALREEEEQTRRDREEKWDEKQKSEDLPSQKRMRDRRDASDAANKQRLQTDQMRREATTFFARFMIKLKCKFRGITPFSADRVLPKFMSRLNLDAKRAVMECNILGVDLFMGNSDTARMIIKELDALNPIYVELIEKAADLYSREELSDLIGSYSSFPDEPVNLDSIRLPLFRFVRKLAALKSFGGMYLSAVDQAVAIQQRMEKKSAGLYISKKKKIKIEWRTLMDDLLPDLVLLVQRSEMARYPLGSMMFNQLVGLDSTQVIGKRKAGAAVGSLHEHSSKRSTSQEDEVSEENEEENPESDVQEMSEEEQKSAAYSDRGMKIMRSFNLSELRKKYDPRGEFTSIADQDKVLLSYMFYKFFEDELSFVLTTTKINMKTSFNAGVKFDYRRKLTDLFETSHSVHDAMKQYNIENKDYIMIVERTSTHSANYVEQARQVSTAENKRSSAARHVRVSIKEFLSNVRVALKPLIDDMNGNKEIILNPDETIRFDTPAEQSKRLNNRPVRRCVEIAYAYSLALSERLEKGDLFGGVIEMSSEDFQAAFGQPSFQVESPQTTSSDETQQSFS